jgi:hypothetical protein
MAEIALKRQASLARGHSDAGIEFAAIGVAARYDTEPKGFEITAPQLVIIMIA